MSRPTSLIEQSFQVLFWDYLLSVPLVLYYLVFFLILSTLVPNIEQLTWEMLKPKLPFLGGLWLLFGVLQLTCSQMVYQLIGQKKRVVDIGESLKIAGIKSWLLMALNMALLGVFVGLMLAIGSSFRGPLALAVLALILVLFRICFDMLPGLLLISDFNVIQLIRFFIFSWRYHARRFFQIVLFLMAVSFLILIVSSQLSLVPNFGPALLVPLWLGVSSTWILILWVLFFQDIRVNVKV